MLEAPYEKENNLTKKKKIKKATCKICGLACTIARKAWKWKKKNNTSLIRCTSMHGWVWEREAFLFSQQAYVIHMCVCVCVCVREREREREEGEERVYLLAVAKKIQGPCTSRIWTHIGNALFPKNLSKLKRISDEVK